MPLQLIRNDITHMQVDAIVNAANKTLLGGGGVDGAIHRAAGPGLMEECRGLGGCKTGEAKITRGYDLPCQYVIHTVGPVWRGGLFGEKDKLAACYWRSMELAYRNGCQSVAFPLISAGAYGYPKDQAMRVAMDTIGAFLLEISEDMTVYLVIFGSDTVQIGKKLFCGIRQYIDDHYVEDHTDFGRESMRAYQAQQSYADDGMCGVEFAMPTAPSGVYEEASADWGLEDALDMIDESFSEMVLRKIKEKGMKNAECYKKANLDKKHFSKISNDIHYKPKKTTALALAVALEMDLEETKELLMKAGLALSHSDKFDIIVEYFIKEGKYNIFEINEALFYYDQTPLGNVVA